MDRRFGLRGQYFGFFEGAAGGLRGIAIFSLVLPFILPGELALLRSYLFRPTLFIAPTLLLGSWMLDLFAAFLARSAITLTETGIVFTGIFGKASFEFNQISAFSGGSNSIGGRYGEVTANGCAYKIPFSISRCHELIAALRREIDRAGAGNCYSMVVIADLELAARYREMEEIFAATISGSVRFTIATLFAMNLMIAVEFWHFPVTHALVWALHGLLYPAGFVVGVTVAMRKRIRRAISHDPIHAPLPAYRDLLVTAAGSALLAYFVGGVLFRMMVVALWAGL